MKNFDALNVADYLFLSAEEKEKLGLSFWTFQNGNSKKEDETNNSSTSVFGKSNLELPNAEDSKLTKEKLTNKKEEEDKYNKRQISEESYQLDHKNTSQIKSVKQLLHSTGLFSAQEIQSIIADLDLRNTQIEIVKDQLNAMKMQVVIYEPVKYFLEGIRRRSSFDLFQDKKEPIPKITLHNWLLDN